ncbi:unnamed protein product [Lymnaea stagnalis]|uniref:G-protein coupled receptors family 1 profile domain-containing protein n=1 Tax=Lymnaea stagnalis TaxID=6523 RepID=A0AAV2HPS4_LYMST
MFGDELFHCRSEQCIPKDLVCDLYNDCLDGDDEDACLHCPHARCQDGRCLPMHWFGDGEVDCCRNMKHLENCEGFDCPAGFLKCPRSYCIPTYYVHNFIADCPNGEDESAYAKIDCSGYFICEMDTLPNVCLHPNFVCDGHKHCPGGDDEVNCNLTCSPGFICLGGVVIVTPSATELDINLLGPETRYFDTSGVDASNVFTDFPFHLFQNVITAKFSGCNISNVTAHFNISSVLNSLRSLDLSGNMIEEVASANIFKRMPGLETLSLSRNFNLVKLSKDAFSIFPFYKSTIEHLDLSFTGIREIHSQFFWPLLCLKTLNVSNTPLVMTQFGLLTRMIKLDVLDLRSISDVTARPDMFKSVIVKQQLFVDSFKLCCPQLHNEKTLIELCHFVKDPFSSCSDLMSSSVLRVFLWVNGFLALLGNAAVIAYRFIFDKRTLRMGYGQFVTHLGFSDMLMGVYLIMIAVADTSYRGSYLFEEFAWRNSTACKVAGLISTLSCEISTFFIFLITLDRFLVIRFPFGKFRLHGRGVVLLCILTWATGTFMAAIPGMQFFGDWSVYTSTGVCVGLPLLPRSDVGWLFAQSLFIYVNFFLFTLIAIGQIVIYRTMVVMSIANSALTNASSRRAQDLTVAKHLSLVVVTNFLCWFPIGVQGLMTLGGYYLGLDAYAWTVVFVLPINSAINPILYTAPAVFSKSCEIKESASRYLTHSKPS